MILGKLRRRKKPEGPRISRSEFLKLRPLRNPIIKWEKNEKGEIKISIPMKKTGEEEKGQKRRRTRRKGFFSRILPTPEERRIQLDVIGSTVWELCDGKRTTKEIIDFLCQKYKFLAREAEISLETYLNSLVKRGLIAFIVPEELKERLEKEALKKTGR
ncbi:MAG: hypothetical protein AYL33_000680 [Candidatus Bathyarchaeota archaeon B63]|nr:MAG: hypothetical protein AYL33_000680 [Candidatus Bathyarchaeota archaeon B63]